MVDGGLFCSYGYDGYYGRIDTNPDNSSKWLLRDDVCNFLYPD